MLTSLAALALTLGWAGTARAAKDGETIVVHEGAFRLTTPQLQFRPTIGAQLRADYELMWSRISLADDFTMSNHHGGSPLAVLSGNFDLRDDLLLTTPRAMTTMASAIGSLFFGGISMFKVIRDGRVRARHSLRAYFRTRGAKLAWRIEF